MFSTKYTNYKYNDTLTMKKWCDVLNVGSKKFYAKLREKGVFYDDENEVRPEYEKYFTTNDSWYAEKAKRPSYCISKEGQDLIKTLFTQDELDEIKKSKYARVRHKKNYKYYDRDVFQYNIPNMEINWDVEVI